MKRIQIFIVLIGLAFIGCENDFPVDQDDSVYQNDLGIVEFYFISEIYGLPEERVKRVFLRLAYNQDSLNHEEFFTSINVSDVISEYRISLPHGEYYYQAKIMCLCELDSCKSFGFPGQYGTRSVGNKITVIKGETIKVTTQFH